MRKPLLWTLAVVILVLALPALKDLFLYATYEHGRQALHREAGQPGSLAGVWVGTFDTYQCAMDERHQLRITILPDSTGHLEYGYLYERIGGVQPYAYSWASVLPFDRSKVRTGRAAIHVSGSTLVILPGEPGFSEHRSTQYAAYELRGDSLYFAYVGAPGERPQEWGLWFSEQLLSPRDLLRSWW